MRNIKNIIEPTFLDKDVKQEFRLRPKHDKPITIYKSTRSCSKCGRCCDAPTFLCLDIQMKSNKLTFITPPWWPIKQKANNLYRERGWRQVNQGKKLLKIKKSKTKDIFLPFSSVPWNQPLPYHLFYTKGSLWKNISKISFMSLHFYFLPIVQTQTRPLYSNGNYNGFEHLKNDLYKIWFDILFKNNEFLIVRISSLLK